MKKYPMDKKFRSLTEEEQNIDMDKQFHVFEKGGVVYKKDKDYDTPTQYRARGFYLKTKRDSWITTEWRDTRLEAISDVKNSVRPDNFKDVRILVKE